MQILEQTGDRLTVGLPRRGLHIAFYVVFLLISASALRQAGPMAVLFMLFGMAMLVAQAQTGRFTIDRAARTVRIDTEAPWGHRTQEVPLAEVTRLIAEPGYRGATKLKLVLASGAQVSLAPPLTYPALNDEVVTRLRWTLSEERAA
jgi:hypothetical protein